MNNKSALKALQSCRTIKKMKEDRGSVTKNELRRLVTQFEETRNLKNCSRKGWKKCLQNQQNSKGNGISRHKIVQHCMQCTSGLKKNKITFHNS